MWMYTVRLHYQSLQVPILNNKYLRRIALGAGKHRSFNAKLSQQQYTWFELKENNQEEDLAKISFSKS